MGDWGDPIIQALHSSSRSHRTASLAGFFDFSHTFDGPRR